MRKLFTLLLCLSILCGCTDVHFIQDANYRSKVAKRFEHRKELAKNRSHQLFDVFNQDLSTQEKEALQFLYAYMPLCDLADYDGEFFFKQVRASFEAKDSFSWGNEIPNELFRHFVLPYRVNNENLDSARIVFLKELKPRLQGLSMKEAALEVNHWCHEKVNYAPTDIRTSGPLSLVRTSWGRCGEESTFTVTALRAVGIPARQVYTPRWAHSDDNHAWVEVWTDGKWSYLGACEPEPDLNMGWFTEPARRAMLVHTKVFGDYQGNDEVVKRSDNFTEINVVSNYADVKKVFVKVIDTSGKAVKNARVDFGLYNYAEFYPIASKNTNEKGLTFLTTGYGDILAWAEKNGKYAGHKLNVSSTDTLVLELGKGFYGEKQAEFNMVPPEEKKPYSVDASMKKQNDIRLAYEDSIRFAYRTTFIDSVSSSELSKSKGLDSDIVWDKFKKSQGNWKAIQKFVENTNDANREYVSILLESISKKDLRDTRTDILLDHLNNSLAEFNLTDYSSKDIFINYILNPRIKNEGLIAYRGFLQKEFVGKFEGSRNEIVDQIKDWILKEIQINETENYYNLPITPKGVYELRMANAESRDVFFVALARSLGVPSRLEPAEKTPQYFDGKKWINVYFEAQKNSQPLMGKVQLKFNLKEFNPMYYVHFSIGKLMNGRYETLDFGWGKKFTELPNQLDLEVGEYRLVTGKRGADGTVYTHLNHFKIAEGEKELLSLTFRDPEVESKVLGQIDLNETVLDSKSKTIPLSQLKKQNTILLMWLEPGKEPTRHLMEEFKDAKPKYENWDGHIGVLQAEGIQAEAMSESFFKNMPENYSVYKDSKDSLLSAVKAELGISGKIQKPLLLALNQKGEIIFTSNGYKIGVHEHLLKRLNK
ncbi:transglutaminase domain-containing protein [Marinifilum sp. N1E240]|uniref:transglutaminase domain-containing protein n=1 Tax=Marinifilum sp. N1E240 TaxID=2608082 RepID=UPI00128D804E|nr:transglutaminase domain-containing protein [Marinifilum sp. N1E240]MPQ46791.1 transglutaminase domain-containing protein [Marinifilum sp. N1E240]